MGDLFDIALFSKLGASKEQVFPFAKIVIKTGLAIHTENITRLVYIILTPFNKVTPQIDPLWGGVVGGQ